MKDGFMLFGYDRKRTSTLTLDSQPGAHTGATRKYIPGYSSSNIIFLNTLTGSDALDGTSIANAKLTYASAATAAGTTKKIRLVNSATLTSNITKPTEATIGTTSTIASSSMTAPVDTWTQATTLNSYSATANGMTWAPWLSKFIGIGGTSKAYYSADGNTWTAAASHGFGADAPQCCTVSLKRKLVIVGGSAGKVGYSSDGSAYTVSSVSEIGSRSINGIAYSESLDRVFIAANDGFTAYSDDGCVTWALGPRIGANDLSGICTNGTTWVVSDGTAAPAYFTGVYTYSLATGGGSAAFRNVFYSTILGKFLYADEGGDTYYSTTGAALTAAATPGFSVDGAFGFAESIELGRVVAFGPGEIAYSSDGDAWTLAGTDSYGATDIYCGAWSPLTGKFASAGVSKAAYSTAFATTISAAIAGFSIQAVQYSGTVTAYNCTLKHPGTTAALSLDSCRLTESGSHISNNAVTSTATLYEGDRHTTCTPASQNAIDCNLDTVGGTWYIYNASATAYERIRDCLVEGGIVANYNVTVSGRANVRGTSSNVLFGATVTFRDPKFVDTTDYKLQFQSNGYARNSLAAGRSALYFNSAGDARDIGAWSYVESAVSYYFAKNVYLPKGQITHSVEEVVSEQQGDSGAVSVYGNVNRIKEVITIKYNTEAEADFNVIRAMRLLTDKTVLIQLDPAWSANAGTVVANGAHSAGADVLNIDAAATYNGMTVTISGKTYYPMRMEPNLTATTRLILDRPLEDAVSDNDVISRNYPSGAGEYQYAAQSRLDLARVDSTVLSGYRSGFIIRLVRAYQ